jgi:hypothetical protein
MPLWVPTGCLHNSRPGVGLALVACAPFWIPVVAVAAILVSDLLAKRQSRKPRFHCSANPRYRFWAHYTVSIRESGIAKQHVQPNRR